MRKSAKVFWINPPSNKSKTKERMKKASLIFLAIVFIGCDSYKREKPFVIVGKNTSYDSGYGWYMYQDANGNKFEFSDTPTAYKIGDTIR